MAALTENFQLKWHSFGSHLHSCVARALCGDAFSDVSLVTMDGHQILAHRFVLSACSQYLQQVLKLHQRVTTTLPIFIVLPPQIDHRTMKTLLQYMYSGETTVSKDILDNVLRGGDLLKISGLWRPKEDQHPKEKCIDSASKQPSHTGHSEPPPLTPLTRPTSLEATASKSGHAHESKKNIPKKKDQAETNNHEEESSDSQFLVIKEEPIEWAEFNGEEMEMVEDDMFETEMTIKPEVFIEEEKEEVFSPLTCELCSETFTRPAEWVRHIQTHTDMLPAKRQRRGRNSNVNSSSSLSNQTSCLIPPLPDEENFPPFLCDLCKQYFGTPGEWIRHIQSSHTDFELRASNRSSSTKPLRVHRQPASQHHKVCAVCDKIFPSHASMLIHKRTHTGEKPYMCELCHKGFNVKSNLLRHLRTLHDKIINSTDVESKEFSTEGGVEESE